MLGFYIVLGYIVSCFIIGKPFACLHGYYLGERHRRYSKPPLLLGDLWGYPGKYFEDRSLGGLFTFVYPICIVILAGMALFFFVVRLPEYIKNIILFVIKMFSKLFPQGTRLWVGVKWERLMNTELITEK